MLAFEDCSMRPLRAEDAQRLLRWRNSERIRANMYTDHKISPAEHNAWLARALSDDRASYLIFEYRRRPVGFVSFTGIDHLQGRCSWGFYLGETDVPRGMGSVMQCFALDHAFSVLGIRKLCSEVFAFNAESVSLHQKFGFSQEGRMVQHCLKNGRFEDIVSLAKFGSTWPQEREAFFSRCFADRYVP
jgi:UDP-4-amino-4,6-dideoxy-N-acetyl-beta-L-altrosamine N-acetyltransferase